MTQRKLHESFRKEWTIYAYSCYAHSNHLKNAKDTTWLLSESLTWGEFQLHIKLFKKRSFINTLTGPIVIAREYSETVLCDANLPSDRKSDWMKWCRGMDVNLPNHRVILDAPGSATIFNGHERLTDQLYTKANTFVAGNCGQVWIYNSRLCIAY